MNSSDRIRQHVRSNVVGYVALALCLTMAPAFAASVTAPKNSVTSKSIKDGQVKAADVNRSQIQLRVNGTCSAGASIKSIAADGTVSCETDVQRRVSGSCDVGSSIASISATGTVTCGPTITTLATHYLFAGGSQQDFLVVPDVGTLRVVCPSNGSGLLSLYFFNPTPPADAIVWHAISDSVVGDQGGETVRHQGQTVSGGNSGEVVTIDFASSSDGYWTAHLSLWRTQAIGDTSTDVLELQLSGRRSVATGCEIAGTLTRR